MTTVDVNSALQPMIVAKCQQRPEPALFHQHDDAGSLTADLDRGPVASPGPVIMTLLVWGRGAIAGTLPA